MFLIKLAFWLCVIITLAPVDTAPRSNAVDINARSSEAFSTQAAGFARATVSDMASFCDRNPQTCATGTEILDRFGVKAIVVAGYVFDAVSGNGKKGPEASGPQSRQMKAVSDPHDTTPDVTAGRHLQNTLTPSDLEAPWVGPGDGDA